MYQYVACGVELDVSYRYAHANTRYDGYLIGEGFAEYMQSRVGPWHRDDAGARILSDVSGVEQGGFNQDILRVHVRAVSWKLGESLAECFLVDYRGVSIPYNKIRDALNPAASPAGIDIVGITEDNMFAMGETKTTSDMQHPPRVIYGRSGLIAQLLDISSNRQVRDSAIRWLGLKLQSPDTIRHYGAWRAALRRYNESDGNTFKMFGMLVRDTTPDALDVKKVHDDVTVSIPASAALEILALYVPVSMPEMPRMMEDEG